MPIVTLIGAPTDIGAGHRGASMGPEALRVAHITEALRESGLEVEDRGNLTGPTNPWAPAGERLPASARSGAVEPQRLSRRARGAG